MLSVRAARGCEFLSVDFKRRFAMRHLAILAMGIFLIATSCPAGAAPLSPAGLPRGDDLSAVVLVQEKAKKNETLTQKVKRVWRDLTGYKFTVSCPAFPIPLLVSRTTCTETGISRDEARGKCASRHPFCAVAEVK
jgi:hypothetical protein